MDKGEVKAGKGRTKTVVEHLLKEQAQHGCAAAAQGEGQQTARCLCHCQHKQKQDQDPYFPCTVVTGDLEEAEALAFPKGTHREHRQKQSDQLRCRRPKGEKAGDLAGPFCLVDPL